MSAAGRQLSGSPVAGRTVAPGPRRWAGVLAATCTTLPAALETPALLVLGRPTAEVVAGPLATAVCLPHAARRAGTVHPRRLLVAGAVLQGVAGVAAAAGSGRRAVALRAVGGAGGAVAVVGAHATARTGVKPSERDLADAVVAAVTGMATVAAPLLVGRAAGVHATPPTAALAAAPALVGLVGSLAVTAPASPDPGRARPHVDDLVRWTAGQALLAAALDGAAPVEASGGLVSAALTARYLTPALPAGAREPAGTVPFLLAALLPSATARRRSVPRAGLAAAAGVPLGVAGPPPPWPRVLGLVAGLVVSRRPRRRRPLPR